MERVIALNPDLTGFPSDLTLKPLYGRATMHDGIEIPEASEGVKYIFCRIPSVVIAPTAVVYMVVHDTQRPIFSAESKFF